MKRTFIAAALALSVGAAFANPDAVVIGAGGAGLSAAVTLHDLGREVVVLEKMPMIGGNTVRAEGGINAAETPQQKKAGIPDTIDQFYADTMKGGHNLNDPALVRTLTTHAKDAVAWLVSLGADLNTVGRAGGAKYPRAHRPTDGSAIGPEVIRVRWKAAKDRKMDVRTQTRATEIIMKDGRVAGVKATTKDGKVYFAIDKESIRLMPRPWCLPPAASAPIRICSSSISPNSRVMRRPISPAQRVTALSLPNTPAQRSWI